MSETILVTGGAGFIGSNFVRQWRTAFPDDSIIVVDKLTYAADPSQINNIDGVELIVGDIQDQSLLCGLLERKIVRKIVHFAAESHVDNSIQGPAPFIYTNIVGTFSLLESARKVWGGDPSCRFLHVSTDEVFGALGATGRFHEEMPYLPNSPYSASKAGSDHLVRAYHHTYGLQVLTTNCSNNYGPRQHREKLIPLTIHRLLEKKPIPVYGDGQQVRDWLFVLDHCDAIMRVIEKGVPGETYCIGGGNEQKNLDLVERLCDVVDEATGRASGSSRKLITFVQDRAGHDRRYAIDASKIRRELGWSPRTPFADGLDLTVAWYLERYTSSAIA